MLIFGHPWVQSPRFVRIFSKDEINKTTANDILLLAPLSDSFSLARYCEENSLAFAVTASSIKEALFANALNARYLVVPQEEAPKIQKIAQEYLMDMRILVLVDSEKEMEKFAEEGIDGILFPAAIV